MKASELERIIAMGIEEAMRWHMGADNRTMVQAIEYGSKKTVAIAVQFGAVTEDGSTPVAQDSITLPVREKPSMFRRLIGMASKDEVSQPAAAKADKPRAPTNPPQTRARSTLGLNSDDWTPLYEAYRLHYGFHFGPDHSSNLKHKLKHRGYRRAPDGYVEYKDFPRFGIPLSISQVRRLVEMKELPEPDYKTRAACGWRPEVIEAFAAKMLELATRP